MRFCKALMIIAAASGCQLAAAADFISTETPEKLIVFGARIGINTSNVTMNKKIFPAYNVNSWGTGFDAGIIADLNIRDYIAVQPGFFFQSRTGRYFYSDSAMAEMPSADNSIQAGHIRSYRFYIPIVASLRFNVTDGLRWNVDLGPYIGTNLHSNEGNGIYYDYFEPDGTHVYSPMRLAATEVGLKMGTGLRILKHYTLGVHYLAGFTHPWKDDYAGGRSKCWTFTIGYDF